jgi:hypothetical protein
MAESKFKWPSPAALLAYCMMVHALFYGMPWQLDPPTQSAGRPKPPPPPATSHWDAMASLVEPHGYELQQHFVTTPGRPFRLMVQCLCSINSLSSGHLTSAAAVLQRALSCASSASPGPERILFRHATAPAPWQPAACTLISTAWTAANHLHPATRPAPAPAPATAGPSAQWFSCSTLSWTALLAG